jgi:hypothetical protein
MQLSKKPASSTLRDADKALRRAALKIKEEATKNGSPLIVLNDTECFGSFANKKTTEKK